MSWISVDQKLIGGKLRELRKGIQSSRNEAIGVLIGLWLWGMDNATPDGTLRGCDREDLAEQIEIGLDRRYDPAEVVSALIEKGWIDENPDGSLQIHDWDEWRKEYNDYMERKRKNRERVKKYREKAAANAQDRGEEDKPNIYNALAAIKQEDRDDTQGSGEGETEGTEGLARIKEQPASKRRTVYSADFEAFWEAYPRHDEKGNAYKKYQARIKDGYSPEELLMAAKGYAEKCRRNHTEQIYIKQPKTFLSDSMPFLDFIPKDGVGSPKRELGENPFL